MTAILQTFFAYPSVPALIGDAVEHAIGNLREKSGITVVQSWRETDIAGRFMVEQILNKIEEAQAFAADISQLNFNVAYEVGFALAKSSATMSTN